MRILLPVSDEKTQADYHPGRSRQNRYVSGEITAEETAEPRDCHRPEKKNDLTRRRTDLAIAAAAYEKSTMQR